MDPRTFADSPTAYRNAPLRSDGGSAASAVLANEPDKIKKRRVTNIGFLIGFTRLGPSTIVGLLGVRGNKARLQVDVFDPVAFWRSPGVQT